MPRITRPPDRAKPTPSRDVGFVGADTAADCEQDRNRKRDESQWTRCTSARLVAIVDAHRRAFPSLALSRDIQLALAHEWAAT